MNNLFDDILSVGFSKVIKIFFGVSTSIFIARSLGPENNGIIASLLVFPSLYMSIGSLGVRQSSTYFIAKQLFNENEIKNAIIQVWLFSTIIGILICFILQIYVNKHSNDILLIILTLIPIPFNLFNIYNSGIFLGKNEIKKFSRINWIPTLVIFLGSIFFVKIFDLGIIGYFFATIMGPLFISLVLLFKNNFINFFSLNFNFFILKKILSLGLIYAFSVLMINLNYKIDIIILQYMSTNFETGIYFRGASLTEYLWQIPMIFSTIIFARSAISKNSKAFSVKILQLLRISFLVISCISFILFIFSENIILLMYGKEFLRSTLVVKLLLPGVVLLTLFKVANMDLAGKGKPLVALKAMMPALFINIVLNIITIPQFGANGAAFSSTISYAFASILFIYLYSKEINVSIIEIVKFRSSDFIIVYNRIFKI